MTMEEEEIILDDEELERKMEEEFKLYHHQEIYDAFNKLLEDMSKLDSRFDQDIIDWVAQRVMEYVTSITHRAIEKKIDRLRESMQN